MRKPPRELDLIHKHSIRHRAAVEAAERCGCFYCLSIFSPGDILDWVDEDKRTGVGQTALCPSCGIDAVLPSSETITVDFNLLVEMEARFFQLLSPAQVTKAAERVGVSAAHPWQQWSPCRSEIGPTATRHGIEEPYNGAISELLGRCFSATLLTPSGHEVVVTSLRHVVDRVWEGTVQRVSAGPGTPSCGMRVTFAEADVHHASLE